MTITYGSVCSGIEAASVAWKPLGWDTSFVSEIEAAPRAVLQHCFPEVPLHGDFTTIREGEYGAIDLLVGGTPCQSFSVAGLRGGLADDRGNLALQYLRLAQRLRPRWLVWENVPGVLSSSGGRDFGAILGGMVELGYGFAYRVLDAQYVRVDGYGRAVPQRRRRVFVVGYFGDWRRPAAVLSERASLRGDPAPRREARQRIAPTLSARPSGGGGLGTDFDCDGGLIACEAAGTLTVGADQTMGFVGDIVAQTAPTLDANFGRLQGCSGQDANHGHAHLIACDCKAGGETSFAIGDVPGALRGAGAGGGHAAIALDLRNALRDPDKIDEVNRQGCGIGEDVAHTLTTGAEPGVAHGWSVRRLTPTECERLQGFPYGHTLVPWRGGLMPDGPRYKMLGNSMACNVMRWIGRRIEAVDALEIAPVLMAAE